MIQTSHLINSTVVTFILIIILLLMLLTWFFVRIYAHHRLFVSYQRKLQELHQSQNALSAINAEYKVLANLYLTTIAQPLANRGYKQLFDKVFVFAQDYFTVYQQYVAQGVINQALKSKLVRCYTLLKAAVDGANTCRILHQAQDDWYQRLYTAEQALVATNNDKEMQHLIYLKTHYQKATQAVVAAEQDLARWVTEINECLNPLGSQLDAELEQLQAQIAHTEQALGVAEVRIIRRVPRSSPPRH